MGQSRRSVLKSVPFIVVIIDVAQPQRRGDQGLVSGECFASSFVSLGVCRRRQALDEAI